MPLFLYKTPPICPTNKLAMFLMTKELDMSPTTYRICTLTPLPTVPSSVTLLTFRAIILTFSGPSHMTRCPGCEMCRWRSESSRKWEFCVYLWTVRVAAVPLCSEEDNCQVARPWTWRHCDPCKRREVLANQHGVTHQKTWIFSLWLILYFRMHVFHLPMAATTSSRFSVRLFRNMAVWLYSVTLFKSLPLRPIYLGPALQMPCHFHLTVHSCAVDCWLNTNSVVK